MPGLGAETTSALSAPRRPGSGYSMTSASQAHSTACTIVSEDCIDCASGYSGKYWVRTLIVREGNQPEGQRPAATSRPGRVIDL